MDLRDLVLFEDADLLGLDKPAGLLVHGDRRHVGQPTLIAAVTAYLGTDCRPGFRPAFVHRLDKETSGVLVLAKNRFSLAALHSQMRTRKVSKHYTAVLVGEIRPRGSIRVALAKRLDRSRWLAVMSPVKSGGVSARTDFERLGLCRLGETVFSLVEARPRTGRTHQIRVHFAAAGRPIAGDELYGDTGLNRWLRAEIGIRRQMLHATRIRFVHPRSGRWTLIESPRPPEFTRFPFASPTRVTP